MATPKPGEIRCPTCHRSTPPAAFCTQCGSSIPSDARIRPRGMDRDELQDRIRARRSGGEPYRRGGPAADEPAGYQRFEPEPEDERARRARQADQRRRDNLAEGGAAGAAAAAVGERGASLTREPDDWPEPAISSPPPPPAEDLEHVDNYDDAAYEEGGYAYAYDDWDDGRDGQSGAGAFAIVGFLALGVLALLGGAVLAGLFSGDGGVGSTDPTATPIVSTAPSEAPSVAPSVDESAAATPAGSGQPTESGAPVTFPDGFSAQAQPCLPGTTKLEGCDSNGSVNSGAVDIWIGFENGNPSDVVGATLLGPDGATLAQGSIDLADINCVAPCSGYTRFPFSGLGPGIYEVRITRNGDLASTTSFEVN